MKLGRPRNLPCECNAPIYSNGRRRGRFSVWCSRCLRTWSTDTKPPRKEYKKAAKAVAQKPTSKRRDAAMIGIRQSGVNNSPSNPPEAKRIDGTLLVLIPEHEERWRELRTRKEAAGLIPSLGAG